MNFKIPHDDFTLFNRIVSVVLVVGLVAVSASSSIAETVDNSANAPPNTDGQIDAIISELKDSELDESTLTARHKKGPHWRYHGWPNSSCQTARTGWTSADTLTEISLLCKIGSIQTHKKVYVRITSEDDQPETIEIIDDTQPCLKCSSCGCPGCCGALSVNHSLENGFSSGDVGTKGMIGLFANSIQAIKFDKPISWTRTVPMNLSSVSISFDTLYCSDSANVHPTLPQVLL